MKYSMSNFDILAIISEIRPKILKGRIQKIYQIGNIFIFKFRTETGTIDLLVETPYRIHITEYERKKPKVPPNFCVKLRKSIKNLRVCNIYQYNLDRVVVLELGYFQVEQETETPKEVIAFKIIFEFFDKGNVILTDNEDIVISALHYKTMRDRRIIPNRTFTFPLTKGQNIMDLTLEGFQNIITNTKKRFIPTLVNKLNIGPSFAQEVCIRSNIDPNAPINSILEKSELIFTEIQNLLSPFKEKQFNPQIIYKNSDFYAISPIDLKIYQDWEKRQFNSINDAVDEFYSLQEETIEKKQIQKEISDLKNKIQGLEKRLEEQQEQLRNLIEKGEKFKTYGDLIYQNLGFIQELLDFINKSRKNNIPWDTIISKLQTFKQEGKEFAKILEKIYPEQAIIELNISDIRFQIDFTDSITKTANKFYQQSKKMLKKVKGAEKAIKDTVKKLETAKLEDSEEQLIIDEPMKKRRKKWFEKFRWLYSSDNFLILGGKDVKTNEILVKKHMNNNDIFVHASFQGAPAVVIQTEGKEVPEKNISEAAQLGIAYSGAWKSGYSQADAFWVKGSEVTFTPPTGEYRKKGSFIISGSKHILKSIPTIIRIGIKIEEDYIYPVICPKKEKEDTLFPIEICPGDLKSSIIAKKIKSHWVSKTDKFELKNKIKKIQIDEIQRLIPAGLSRIKNLIK